MGLFVDRRPVAHGPGESLLVAMLRAGLHPTGGGCLCLAGDCPHCLATVDGVSYVRTCQVRARDGTRVERHHRAGGQPPLDAHPAAPAAAPAAARHLHCDVVVIGGGAAGRAEAARARAAGAETLVLDAAAGHEVAGIYPGPTVMARSAGEVLCVYPRKEIVVATGAAEIQPVAPGSGLEGLATARAATALAAAGIDLGRVAAVGEPPEGVECERLAGEIIRFEGERRLEAVVVSQAGVESRHPCDTVALGLGLHPRDALARMARGLPIALRVVGDAARECDLPPCPRAGTVCPCSGVDVGDLERVWNNGFHELELVKRATLAGTGTCQGSACLPWVRSFLAARGRVLQPPFTARPLTRQLTLAEAAAGAHHPSHPRTALHDEHLALGARMERAGGWWRPWDFGDVEAEMAAVRQAVSIGDVGTLGKFTLAGPDALELLELLCPTRVETLRPGRSRYVLLLDERGYVLDDGMIARVGAERFYLTLTSAGASFGEMWIRDWAESRGLEARLINQTQTLGAVNVTGPRAAELLARAGATALPAFARHLRAEIAGVSCRVLRLSFTGELSYELHHAAADSVRLWRALLESGAGLGVRPHGLDALLRLRLEKGHIIVGQDTAFDSTPRRIDHEWAVRLDKPEFVGRAAVERTGRQPLDRRLVGLEMESPAPAEGAVARVGERYAGFVTSASDSPTLGKAVMLGWLWLQDGEVPSEVTIDGRAARRAALPFYDPDSERSRARVDLAELGTTAEAARGEPRASGSEPSPDSDLGAFARLEAVRIVARPEALDALSLDGEVLALRLAGDELLVIDDAAEAAGELGPVDDPHALVERETGLAGAWLRVAETRELAARCCEWELPAERPALAQGALAGIPVKLWLEEERALLVVPAAHAADLARRVTAALEEAGG